MGEFVAGRVTIKSIAQDLGISHMTVSRALSGHRNVQKETREAVQRRARELGYVKSAAATTMRGNATKIIGLLLPNITNEFYARFANIMAHACEAHSYHLIIHLTSDDPDIERQSLARLREVQARAVVMVPAPGQDDAPNPHLEALQVIQLIRRRQIPSADGAILVDDHAAIRDAVVHLAGEGHCAIAYIGADVALSSGRERLAAFRAGLKAAGLSEDVDLIHTDAPSFEMGCNAAASILDSANATGLVCGGFEISNGALSTLMGRGVSPSGPFAFVGYGDPSFYTWIDRGVSTIRVPVDSLACRAIELVVAAQDAPDAPANIADSFQAELVVRGSRAKGT